MGFSYAMHLNRKYRYSHPQMVDRFSQTTAAQHQQISVAKAGTAHPTYWDHPTVFVEGLQLSKLVNRTYLVGGIPTHPKKYKSVKWDDFSKKISHVPVTTNQIISHKIP